MNKTLKFYLINVGLYYVVLSILYFFIFQLLFGADAHLLIRLIGAGLFAYFKPIVFKQQ
jgi:hypothetical protein